MRNVATLAKTPRQESKKHAAPNAADVERLVSAMRGERLEPLLLVLLGTGLRRQEVLGLTWERTHLEGPYPELRVDKRVARAGGQLAARAGAKTEAGQRRVPLVPLVMNALIQRRTQALAEREHAGDLCPDGSRVQTNVTGPLPTLAWAHLRAR